MMLAGFPGILFRLRRVPLRGMSMVGGFFVVILFVMLGRVAMMLRRLVVMVGRGLVMFHYLLLRPLSFA